MTETLLSSSAQEEALSRVYARAVASRAGYVTADYDFDLDGIDLRIQAGGTERPALELQLKATINLGNPKNGHISFPLPQRNYNLLVVNAQTPRLLMVLELPRDKQNWMSITHESLILRRRAYWLSLKGYPKTTNTSSVSVHLPTTNIFDVNSLKDLMEQSRKRAI